MQKMQWSTAAEASEGSTMPFLYQAVALLDQMVRWRRECSENSFQGLKKIFRQEDTQQF